MRVKEKAEEIVFEIEAILCPKFENGRNKETIECSKLVVDKIIEALKVTIGHCTLNTLDYHECMSDIKYWKEVKQEIEKL